uniref:Uncharacterized protein n=1 Tax=candidate division WOR-3 bacterium TaxID=2052148 RepID=A0A7C4C9X9_UNCW3
MTKLHLNFKDVFRAIRLGFSAKKIWMMFLGLLFGMAGYTVSTYIAYAVAGQDWLTVWDNYRLLPFPRPDVWAFPWYSWVIYASGVLWLLIVMLLAGTAVSRVAFEQLRGDEFYESRTAFRFAFDHASSVLLAPLLLVGFVLLIALGGIVLGLIGLIPHFGNLFIGLMAFPAFIASAFIVYLLVVLLFAILIGPAVVGTTRNDVFDTLFEVFSCVNEQPWRLVWYTFVVGVLAKFGSLLAGLATSAAGRIGTFIVGLVARDHLAEVLNTAAAQFVVTIPSTGLFTPFHFLYVLEARLYGLPQMYAPLYETAFVSWSVSTAGALVGACLYVLALFVVAYGCSVWFTGNVLSYAVLVHKKDERNILEVPDDEAELIDPVARHEQAASAPTGGSQEPPAA